MRAFLSKTTATPVNRDMMLDALLLDEGALRRCAP